MKQFKDSSPLTIARETLRQLASQRIQPTPETVSYTHLDVYKRQIRKLSHSHSKMTAYLNNDKTLLGNWLACANIATPACWSIWFRVRFADSAAKSASLIRERAADKFSEVDCKLDIVLSRRFCLSLIHIYCIFLIWLQINSIFTLFCVVTNTNSLELSALWQCCLLYTSSRCDRFWNRV